MKEIKITNKEEMIKTGIELFNLDPEKDHDIAFKAEAEDGMYVEIIRWAVFDFEGNEVPDDINPFNYDPDSKLLRIVEGEMKVIF